MSDALSDFMIPPYVCACVSVFLPFIAHKGKRSQAEEYGVREVRPTVRHSGGKEERDESESDSRTGGEGQLYPRPDQEVRGPSRGELQDRGDGDPDDGGAGNGCISTGQKL